MVGALEVSPISIQDLWNTARMTFGFLFTSLTEALLLHLVMMMETVFHVISTWPDIYSIAYY